jgi:pimeloyl-ACP methyl ester carboxylesterase
MDPLYDPVAPTRQGYVTVPLHHHHGLAAAKDDSDGGPSLFWEVFSPPPSPPSPSPPSSSSPSSSSPLPPLGAQRDPCDKVVLVMGAFCTRRMFEPLAAELARRGYHALVFDHRGVGASSPAAAPSSAKAPPPPPPPPSARLLAADALAVADHAFGDNDGPNSHPPKLHVLGASMGGMVACELAVLLARGQEGRRGARSGSGRPTTTTATAPPSSRLASLTVMVSCRGLQPALWRAFGFSPPPAVLQPIIRWLFPVPPPAQASPSTAPGARTPPPCPAVARMVERLMRDIVCPRLLETPYPDQRRAAEFVAKVKASSSGGDGDDDAPTAAPAAPPSSSSAPSTLTYRDAYRALWTSRFHELFCFADPSVGAYHTSLLFGTRLSARKAAAISSCGAPVLSLVAERDSVLAPRAQRELARMLGARVVSVPTGHVGLGPWQQVFYEALDETLRAGRVAMAAGAEAGAGAGSGGGGGDLAPPAATVAVRA